MPERVKILVSACLLGERVRYDGGHKKDHFLNGTLGRLVEFVRICPEVDCGLPVPREPMRLVGDPDRPRLVTTRTGIDHTERMERWAKARLEELSGLDLYGYICKKDSPSSGMERVRVYGDGIPARSGSGVFTRMFMKRFPRIPVEEEERLADPDLRGMFIERMFCLRRFRDLLDRPLSRGALVEFHTDHKLLLLSHDRGRYGEMGRLVAGARTLSNETLYRKYEEIFMSALSRKATPKKCADVFYHMMGYFTKMLSTTDKQELIDVIDRYRRQLVPMAAPITLLRHYARKYDVAYLRRQVFIHPHPVEWMLRNPV